MVGAVGEREPAQIAHRLAQHQAALVMQPAAHIDAVELIGDAGGARIELLAVVGRPPGGQVASGVELRALVVEAVAHLVPNHGPDGAVVHRIVRAGAEEGELENAGREHDLVAPGIVIGVDRGRRHAPVVAVERLADFGQAIEIVAEPRDARVFEVGLAADADRGVVAPPVRVADLGVECLELGGGVLPRFGIEPVGFLERIAERGAQVVDQFLHPPLALGREVLLHEDLAERIAQVAVNLFGAGLPARLLFLHAGQNGLAEVEILVAKRLGEIGGGVVEQAPAQPGFPVRQGHGVHLVADRFDELGLAHIHRRGVGKIELAEQHLPVVAGGQLGDAGQVQAVIGGVGIAALDARHGGLGQRRLEGHDGACLGGRGLGRVSGQPERFGDMLHELVADVLVALVVREVVVAVRQRQAAGEHGGDGLLGVLIVLRREKDQGADAPHALQRVQSGLEVSGRLDGGDAVQVGLERAEAGRIDGIGGQAACVEVADLLFVAAGGGGSVLSGGIENDAQALAVLLGQHRKGAPGRKAGGDRIFVDPAAVGVAPEILAWLAGGVEIRAVDPALGSLLGGGQAAKHKENGESSTDAHGTSRLNFIRPQWAAVAEERAPRRIACGRTAERYRPAPPEERRP